jgi:uncharacterized protein YggE
MYFKHFICRNIIYLAVCLIFSSQLAFATQPVRMLTVTGVAVVKVKPDQAKLTWTIEARADAPASAMAALRSKTASILAALEAFGLPKEDLACSVLSLSPNFQYIDRQPPKLLDYSATTRLEVTINHLPAFPEIVQIGLDFGVTALGNLVFLTKDEARWQSQARQNAMKDALVKAQDYAEAADVKLGQLISLTDSVAERSGPPGFLSAQRGLSEAGIVPKDVVFRQSVIAQYEIVAKPE